MSQSQATTAVTTAWTSLPSGIRVFSRTAGPIDGANILLLHGYPSSSHQFRNLIPLLASHGYRVTAPDLPGFGFTEIPPEVKYEHTFANLATSISSFIDVAGINGDLAIYIFDYGAPTGLRLALERPDRVKAIVSQNGNAYEEGLLPFWDPLRKLWAASPGSTEELDLRQAIANFMLTLETTKSQYVGGEPHPETIDPSSWTLDYALLERPGQRDIQLDLFKDYGTNLTVYPQFQEYFRGSQVPLLAVWGKGDTIFGHPEAFKKDLPNAEIELWDGGHFLVESHTQELGQRIVKFLKDNGFPPRH
ncbi:hypothetical protein PMZ80_000434 [Knufia obscura]|uniref:AB hydrolase-1 domain-containing protein n=1 Tax=Knufia obscura TaxID=1635080 RepID=A0ABR0S089_9EURO|nr:hypothetical protein PMZ80_000434 [Knufia obscura]